MKANKEVHGSRDVDDILLNNLKTTSHEMPLTGCHRDSEKYSKTSVDIFQDFVTP